MFKLVLYRRQKAQGFYRFVAVVVELLTALGVYCLTANAIKQELTQEGITKLKSTAEGLVADANNSYRNITDIQAQAEKSPSEMKLEMKSHQFAEANGYTLPGDIKFVWGTVQSKKASDDVDQKFLFYQGSFPCACFTVIPSSAGNICSWG